MIIFVTPRACARPVVNATTFHTASILDLTLGEGVLRLQSLNNTPSDRSSSGNYEESEVEVVSQVSSIQT
jgi:hypothetical protein